MEVLVLLAFGAYGAVAFLLGAIVVQKAIGGKPIELPKVNPMEKIKEHKERKEAEKQQEWKDAVLRNIEAYDGTSVGQKDVPRG